jgi:hypothetical protein
MPNKHDRRGNAAQNFAFGGIANPTQVATLRGADQAYLAARQKELDEFEAQRQAYNNSLTKWQTEVYEPYKSQVSAYNEASQKYNTDVYNPYKSQMNAYNAAAEKYNTDVYNPYKGQVDAYNAARQKYDTEVYSPHQEKYKQYEKEMQIWQANNSGDYYQGPAPTEPKLASEFTLAAPTTPTAFGMTAPTEPTAFGMTAPTTPGEFTGTAPAAPFKEAEVVAYQKEAAERARQDAGQRALALDVVSNPDQFNFGSLSVSSQFMAHGGEVKQKSAKEMLRGHGFARGGSADLDAMNAENLSDDTAEEAIDTDPLGSAQSMLAEMAPPKKAAPVPRSSKKAAGKGGATSGKEMEMSYESLSGAKSLVPQLKETGSARAQMEALAKEYKLRAQAATEQSKGLLRSTMNAPTLDKPNLGRATLAAKRFEKGGEAKKPEVDSAPKVTGINRVMDFIAQRLPASSFPTAGKTLLETVQGKREPITESNFSPDELDILRQLVNTKKEDKGAVTYADYSNLVKQVRKKGELPVSATPSLFSLGDALGNVQTTLGQFQYARDPQGNLSVTDTYDFNPPNPYLTQEARTGEYGAMGPYGLIREYAGEKVPPGKGRQVQINLSNPFKRAKGSPVERAEGSPEEGELSQEEIDAASRPAFVTPKSGKGRKQGPISQQLQSGEAYVNMAKGLTNMPYNLAGAPMDLVMLARQGLTGQAPAGQVGTSDYIKSKMTELGVRPEPPADPTEKGFYTAGDLLSNLVNPAGVTRAGVKGAEKVGQAATGVAKDFQQYNRQLSVPGASYAVRPTGSTMLSGPVGLDKNVGEVERIVQGGISNSGNATQEDLIKNFWDKKARNYFTRQFGTPDDPIAKGISNKTIKGSALEEMFPEYMIDQIAVGKTRLKEGARPADFVGPGKPEERFFPKYPRAMEDLTKRYDEATDLQGNLITTNPAAADLQYNSLSTEGRNMGRSASELEADKMIVQGVNPLLINNRVGVATRSIKEPDRIVTDGTSSAKDLYAAFEESSAYNKLSPGQKTDFANDLFGKGRPVAGMDETDIGKNLLSENVRTAIERGEPIYDVGYMRKPLLDLFNPVPINTYLDSLPPRELANIRFEDAVRGGMKVRERTTELENLVARIKSGKPVADKVFSQGVSKPLLQFDKDSGFEGFAWKQIEKREATVPEGAYVGHSVGGYELGGPGYTSVKRDGFNTGLYRVYTLRDNRNRPVNTIEVKMEDANTPVVTQIKGNGRATGNAPAEKYDGAILRFLQTYLKPSAITESDSYLTPLLQNYQAELQMERRARIAVERHRAGMEEIERLRNQLR